MSLNLPLTLSLSRPLYVPPCRAGRAHAIHKVQSRRQMLLCREIQRKPCRGVLQQWQRRRDEGCGREGRWGGGETLVQTLQQLLADVWLSEDGRHAVDGLLRLWQRYPTRRLQLLDHTHTVGHDLGLWCWWLWCWQRGGGDVHRLCACGREDCWLSCRWWWRWCGHQPLQLFFDSGVFVLNLVNFRLQPRHRVALHRHTVADGITTTITTSRLGGLLGISILLLLLLLWCVLGCFLLAISSCRRRTDLDIDMDVQQPHGVAHTGPRRGPPPTEEVPRLDHPVLSQ
mmetsp:Transcript_23994/g.69125  ORF Transcript_23994/g.69125 Transcript_23994/m.69125 type:complete len:285 (-) Transcript_23994:425-1279(-)